MSALFKPRAALYTFQLEKKYENTKLVEHERNSSKLKWKGIEFKLLFFTYHTIMRAYRPREKCILVCEN